MTRAVLVAGSMSIVWLFAAPLVAEAYLGPGGVVSGIGAFIALIAAVVASIFGFVWFPLKRLLRGLRSRGEKLRPDVSAPSSTPSE